ncbi:MAG: hypothetical protein ACKO6Q_09350 [Bacteroidota bacterium]
MKLFRHTLLALLLPFASTAQSIAGYWYGSAFVTGSQASQHNYLIELILTDNGRTVKGVMNYYFRNLYRSVSVDGAFVRKQQQLTLNQVPFLYYGSLEQMEVDCQMSGAFNLVISRVGSSLSGLWKPADNYKYTCPPIQFRLSLDREQSVNDSLIQALKIWKEQYQVWTPQKGDNNQSPIAVTPRPVKNLVAVQQQEKREQVLAEELEVDADSVRISLYDNGEVDGDSISIFLNKKLIATHQRLTTRPIQLTLPLDSLQDYVELIMFAENLGSIPPNTALMVVEAGEKTYQLRLSSTLDKSAKVRIKRKRKGLRIR